MTEAEIRQAIREALEEREATITAAFTEMKADIEAAIAASTMDCVKGGDPIALQSANGQVLCARDGGPTEPEQLFEFESRDPDAIGPHETFTVLKP